MLICQICNRECKNNIGLVSHVVRCHKLHSKEYYDKYLKKENEGICICGRETTFNRINKGYYKHCGQKCSANSNYKKEKIKKTNIEKYGVENPSQNNEIKEKKKQTSIKNWSVECPLQNKKVREKTKQTNIEKYGVENVFQSEYIKEKIKKTTIEKYGCKYPSQNIEIRNKQRMTCLKKYGVENPNQNTNIKNKSRKKRICKLIPKVEKLLEYNNLELLSEYKRNRDLLKLKCLKCNIMFKSNYFNIQQGYGKCPECFPRNLGYSNTEKELSEFIKSIEQSEIIENSRNIIPPYELDIFIPDKNIAIEFNGLYWHSEGQGKNKNYHLNKTELCESKNIQLIQIFEDEWINNNVKIKELLTKILLEDYDLLDSDNLIMDRRFSKNLDYYTNKGYKIDIQSPKLYSNYYNYKIYDCGYYELMESHSIRLEV